MGFLYTQSMSMSIWVIYGVLTKRTSAHLDALCMLFIVEKRRIYMQPKVRLHNAQISAINAAVRITGWSLPST